MSSYRQIVKEEILPCRLKVHKERFRKKSFDGQNEEFGLIDVFSITSNSYLGSIPLWWDDEMLNCIMIEGEWEECIHRFTVSTLQPMIHRWTYEDVRKGLCRFEDQGNLELLSSGIPKTYYQISFLVREIIDNQTLRWESREADIDEAVRSVCRWCYPYMHKIVL